MSIQELTKRLQNIPLFSTLDSSLLKLLAFTSEVSEYTDQEALFQQDDGADSVFVILEGEVEIRRTHEQEEMVVDTKHSGQTVGEMAVLRDARRSAAVVAVGNVQTMKISGEFFLDLIADNPKLALFVLKDLSARLDDTTQALTLATRKLK
jgi:CRP-like cAMP-binding protein